MSLISIQFAGFFLAALALYYILPLKIRWWGLLAGSAAFYFLTATHYTALYLIFSITSVFLAARYIGNDSSRHKKAAYLLAICCNAALLVILKYLNGFWFSAGQVFSFAGVALPPFELGWIAPLGMSFYTLQLISYLTDVYWGISPVQKNPAKLALFASYFPSIGSGPISRYNQVEAALFDGHRASYKNLTFGAQRMLWGLFKKVVIAERLAWVSKPVFANIDAYSGFWLWIGLAAAAIQLYADFSGNMDFILGVSECFGVVLPENFRQPFFSRTIQEFFQRWHITLGGWLKDYIMFPLMRSKMFARLNKYLKKRFGKSAAKAVPSFLAMFALWLVNGVWHSPYPKYIATALWFWFAVTAGQLLEPIGNKAVKLLHINTDCFSWRLFQRLRTVTVYAIGVNFFASPGIITALKVAKRALFARNFFDLFSETTFVSGKLLELTGGKLGLFVILLSTMILAGVEVFQNRGGSAREWLAKQNLLFRWIILIGLIFAIIIFGIYGPGYDASEFIYAGF